MKVQQFFPLFEHEKDQTRFADLLNTMLLSVMAGAAIYMIALPLMAPELLYRLIIFIPIFPLILGLRGLMNRGYLKEAAFLLPVVVWGALTLAAMTAGGVRAPAFNGYIIAVLIAGLLLGGRFGLFFAGLSILSGAGLLMADMNDLLPALSASHTQLWFWGSETLYFLMAAVVLHLATRNLNDALARARRHEDALEHSENRYRVISELTSDYAYAARIEPNGRLRFEWVTDALARITGLTLQDAVTSETWFKMIHPDDIPLVAEQSQLIQGGESVVNEYRIVTQSGETRWVRAHVHPVWDDSEQRVERIYGAAQDITERKQMEEAWRESEDRLRAVVENVPDFIATVNRDGTLVYLNHTLSGFDEKELMGTTVYNYVLPEYHSMVKKVFERVFKSGQAESYETAGLGADGGISWYASRVSPIKRQGDVVCVTLISTDITNRKIGEETLKESESRYRSLFEDSPISLWEEDFSEVKTYIDGLRKKGISDFRGYFEEHPEAVAYGTKLVKILDCNQASLDLFKADSKERLCGRLEKITRKDTLDIFREELIALAEGKTKFEIEAVQQTLTGDKLYVVLGCSVAPNYEESWAKVFVSVIDITERKRIEQALSAERASLAERVEERTAELSAANAELARAARLKDEFLANMSHELRTPLNAVLGMSKVLKRQVYGTLNTEQMNALGHIDESGRHLLALINDILDLSKIEAGKAELTMRPVSASDVCQASLLFIKQMAHQKQLKVLLTSDRMVETIVVDQRRLKQILVNLLSNAVKFTSAGGRIGLEMEGNQERGVVHFTVWDTGIGISEEDAKRLFKPFVQIDSSLSRQHEGTGLGLSLVYRLTELHGGSVSLESEVGKGSRFTVSLPWQKSKIEKQHNRQIQPNKKNRHRERTSQALILLAEDNETNIITMQGLLKASNYRLIVARNGAEAIVRAREERPDLILMDIQMPSMDGLEATRRLRADNDLATIPIIALTALAMPGDRERCLQAGANDYLSKPVDLDGLIESIEAQL